MRENSTQQNSVALLATGDEIINGDILNSNSQVIAERLFRHGIRVGMHLSASDHVNEIERALLFLLQTHRAVITTGGLGPTSDDLTRYAISKVVNRPLVFDEKVWEAICRRINSLGYQGPPPEGNRQQALFPEGATLIPNDNGTAAGCITEIEDKLIFMLPGPPIECITMFDAVVLPKLQQFHFQEILYYEHWLLFGVSEGHIATELDALAKSYDCITGYRLFYPYIEFKLYSNHKKDFTALSKVIEKTIEPYLFKNGKQPASVLLQKKLQQQSVPLLNIRDLATGGLLENTIKNPDTSIYLNFNPQDIAIEITGLDEYWARKKGTTTHLTLKFPQGEICHKQIPFRGERVKQYAVEFICQQLYQFLEKNSG